MPVCYQRLRMNEIKTKQQGKKVFERQFFPSFIAPSLYEKKKKCN